MAYHEISFMLNGEWEQKEIPSNMTLLEMLREKFVLTGTKNGCASGECGACTVLMNGEPVNSCLVLAAECDRTEIVTIEGLVGDERFNILQSTIIAAGGVQCGFCTPGVLINTYALFDRVNKPDEEDIRVALVGNLCRCTGYTRIVESVQKAADRIVENLG